MSAETVTAEHNENVEPIESATEPVEAQEPIQEAAPPKEELVPLSALQKERRKRQETEQEMRWYREQMQRASQPQAPVEPDASDEEPLSRSEFKKGTQKVIREAVRASLEEQWMRQNPEKAADINDKLPEFLKQRPHLARAIEDAPNRYEEAWTLMDALTPKQKAALKPAPAPRTDAPGNPAAVPKAQGMNQSVDVMSMSDSEFNAWRQSQRKRR